MSRKSLHDTATKSLPLCQISRYVISMEVVRCEILIFSLTKIGFHGNIIGCSYKGNICLFNRLNGLWTYLDENLFSHTKNIGLNLCDGLNFVSCEQSISFEQF